MLDPCTQSLSFLALAGTHHGPYRDTLTDGLPATQELFRLTAPSTSAARAHAANMHLLLRRGVRVAALAAWSDAVVPLHSAVLGAWGPHPDLIRGLVVDPAYQSKAASAPATVGNVDSRAMSASASSYDEGRSTLVPTLDVNPLSLIARFVATATAMGALPCNTIPGSHDVDAVAVGGAAHPRPLAWSPFTPLQLMSQSLLLPMNAVPAPRHTLAAIADAKRYISTLAGALARMQQARAAAAACLSQLTAAETPEPNHLVAANSMIATVSMDIAVVLGSLVANTTNSDADATDTKTVPKGPVAVAGRRYTQSLLLAFAATAPASAAASAASAVDLARSLAHTSATPQSHSKMAPSPQAHGVTEIAAATVAAMAAASVATRAHLASSVLMRVSGLARSSLVTSAVNSHINVKEGHATLPFPLAGTAEEEAAAAAAAETAAEAAEAEVEAEADALAAATSVFPVTAITDAGITSMAAISKQLSTNPSVDTAPASIKSAANGTNSVPTATLAPHSGVDVQSPSVSHLFAAGALEDAFAVGAEFAFGGVMLPSLTTPTVNSGYNVCANDANNTATTAPANIFDSDLPRVTSVSALISVYARRSNSKRLAMLAESALVKQRLRHGNTAKVGVGAGVRVRMELPVATALSTVTSLALTIDLDADLPLLETALWGDLAGFSAVLTRLRALSAALTALPAPEDRERAELLNRQKGLFSEQLSRLHTAVSWVTHPPIPGQPLPAQSSPSAAVLASLPPWRSLPLTTALNSTVAAGAQAASTPSELPSILISRRPLSQLVTTARRPRHDVVLWHQAREAYSTDAMLAPYTAAAVAAATTALARPSQRPAPSVIAGSNGGSRRRTTVSLHSALPTPAHCVTHAYLHAQASSAQSASQAQASARAVDALLQSTSVRAAVGVATHPLMTQSPWEQSTDCVNAANSAHNVRLITARNTTIGQDEDQFNQNEDEHSSIRDHSYVSEAAVIATTRGAALLSPITPLLQTPARDGAGSSGASPLERLAWALISRFPLVAQSTLRATVPAVTCSQFMPSGDQGVAADKNAQVDLDAEADTTVSPWVVTVASTAADTAPPLLDGVKEDFSSPYVLPLPTRPPCNLVTGPNAHPETGASLSNTAVSANAATTAAMAATARFALARASAAATSAAALHASPSLSTPSNISALLPLLLPLTTLRAAAATLAAAAAASAAGAATAGAGSSSAAMRAPLLSLMHHASAAAAAAGNSTAAGDLEWASAVAAASANTNALASSASVNGSGAKSSVDAEDAKVLADVLLGVAPVSALFQTVAKAAASAAASAATTRDIGAQGSTTTITASNNGSNVVSGASGLMAISAPVNNNTFNSNANKTLPTSAIMGASSSSAVIGSSSATTAASTAANTAADRTVDRTVRALADALVLGLCRAVEVADNDAAVAAALALDDGCGDCDLEQRPHPLLPQLPASAIVVQRPVHCPGLIPPALPQAALWLRTAAANYESSNYNDVVAGGNYGPSAFENAAEAEAALQARAQSQQQAMAELESALNHSDNPADRNSAAYTTDPESVSEVGASQVGPKPSAGDNSNRIGNAQDDDAEDLAFVQSMLAQKRASVASPVANINVSAASAQTGTTARAPAKSWFGSLFSRNNATTQHQPSLSESDADVERVWVPAHERTNASTANTSTFSSPQLAQEQSQQVPLQHRFAGDFDDIEFVAVSKSNQNAQPSVTNKGLLRNSDFHNKDTKPKQLNGDVDVEELYRSFAANDHSTSASGQSQPRSALESEVAMVEAALANLTAENYAARGNLSSSGNNTSSNDALLHHNQPQSQSQTSKSKSKPQYSQNDCAHINVTESICTDKDCARKRGSSSSTGTSNTGSAVTETPMCTVYQCKQCGLVDHVIEPTDTDVTGAMSVNSKASPGRAEEQFDVDRAYADLLMSTTSTRV